MDAVTEAATDERQTDILAVLVAVADNNAVRRVGHGKHCHQFRFAAGLQTHALTAMAVQRLDHAALLIHLDGVDCRVAAAVVMTAHGLGEGAAQGVDTVAHDVIETYQNRQREICLMDLIDQLPQIDLSAAGVASWACHQVPAGIGVEIAFGPIREVVGGARGV